MLVDKMQEWQAVTVWLWAHLGTIHLGTVTNISTSGSDSSNTTILGATDGPLGGSDE